MAIDLTGQVMALAAIFQWATQVESLAKQGRCDNHLLEVAINGLFCQNPDAPIEVYGQLPHLRTGLNALLDSLQRKPASHHDTIRYVMGILHLQKRLQKKQGMLGTIATRLQKSWQQAEHFSTTHENVVASLADIYSETISTFSFRIQVMGEYQHLQQQHVANQIRVFLFSGIRSAVLWRQLGGSRAKVIFQRKRLINQCRQLLNQAEKPGL